MSRAGIIALLAAFFLGAVFSNAAQDDETKTKYRVVHHTETVTETETEYVEVVPDACADLVAVTFKINKAASQLDTGSADLLAIMSEQREALAAQDSNRTNTLETRLRKVNSSTVGAVETLGELQYEFDEASAECGADQ